MFPISLWPDISIERYSIGVMGAQLVYSCQQGLEPTTRMMATCRDDGSWDPSPSDLVCDKGVDSRQPSTSPRI